MRAPPGIRFIIITTSTDSFLPFKLWRKGCGRRSHTRTHLSSKMSSYISMIKKFLLQYIAKQWTSVPKLCSVNMTHTGKAHSHLFSPLSGSLFLFQLFHLYEFLFCAHVKNPRIFKPPQIKCLGQASEILYKKSETSSICHNLFGRIQSGLQCSCAAIGMISFFCLRKGVSQEKCLTKMFSLPCINHIQVDKCHTCSRRRS